MSFYHVLPSNVAPETYPKNVASAYTTPLGAPYNLQGKWQVALTGISYSGCVNTFIETDNIRVTKKLKTVEDLKTITRPVRIDLPQTVKTHFQIANLLNNTLEGILEVKHVKQPMPYVEGHDYFSWVGKNSELLIVLSQSLKEAFKLWQNVISSYDTVTTNHDPWKTTAELSADIPAEKLKDLYVILVPTTYNAKKIVVKEANEDITVEKLVARVNARIPNVKLKLAASRKHFMLEKHCAAGEHCYEDVILMSKEFHKSLGFRRAAMYRSGLVRYKEYSFDQQFKQEWSVTLVRVNEVCDASAPYEWIYSLKSKSFRDYTNAVKYLNTLDSDVQFTLGDDKKLTLEIKAEEMKVAFSPVLRDCLAFDADSYDNKGKHVASGVFSLKRRISHLYIYSNVGEYCRIGDMQAPLLGIVPLEGEGCDIVQEKLFQNPMYVPLRSNHMSHIEVLLCDGAGVVVPFTADARTVVCIHFKQV